MILGPDGKPVPRPAPRGDRCPQCNAGPEHRVKSGGFGAEVHDVCCKCGYEFKEGA